MAKIDGINSNISSVQSGISPRQTTSTAKNTEIAKTFENDEIRDNVSISEKEEKPEAVRIKVFTRDLNEKWWTSSGEKWTDGDGKPLERNPICPEKPGSTGDLKTEAHEKLIIKDDFTSHPKSSRVKFREIDSNGELFIASSKRTQVRDGKFATQSHNELTDRGWMTTMKVFAEANREDNRETRNNYRVENLLADPDREKLLKEEEEQLKLLTPEIQLEYDRGRYSHIGYLLEDRYGDRKNLDILEIGPYTTTMVPRTILKEGSGNQYTGLDVSEAGLRKQREVLDYAGGYAAENSRQVVGDLYHIPRDDNSTDLIVSLGGSFPFYSRESDAKEAINEISRVLKPEGEFVLNTGILEVAMPGTIAHIMKNFDITASADGGETIIFKKK